MAEKYGEWAFLLGVLLAVVIGLFSSSLGSEVITYVYAVLVLLGLVVGLLNIREKEINSFLIATIALMMVGSSWQPVTAILTIVMSATPVTADLGMSIVTWIQGFFGALVAFVAPAAFVVALKAVYNLAARPR